jgi:hypothetical protein
MGTTVGIFFCGFLRLLAAKNSEEDWPQKSAKGAKKEMVRIYWEESFARVLGIDAHRDAATIRFFDFWKNRRGRI